MGCITFDADTGLFCLRTVRTLYQMKVGRFGYLQHLYYGQDIGRTDASYRIVCLDRGFSPNPPEAGEDRTFSLDSLPQEYSGEGNGDYRFCSAAARLPDGSRCLDLKYEGHRILEGKYSLPGMPALFADPDKAQTLEITLSDSRSGLKAVLLFGVIPQADLITRAVRFENHGKETVALEKAMSMQMDILEPDMEIIHFHGRHTMERMPERIPFAHGALSVGSTRGASSHQHNPFVILCEKDTNETSGRCYGAALVYSGNFLMRAEVDQYGMTRFAAGIHPEGFSWGLEPGETFSTPEVMMAFSGEGFGHLTHLFHDGMREHLIRSSYCKTPRPILVNSWEAAYFNFDEKLLFGIAENAKNVGLDLFVVDDGWFGRRENDNCALGDWVVNEDKIRGGLKALSEKIRAIDLQLGIWIEPEMISEDSDLYRTHPDWCLKNPGREPVRGRGQLNLDIIRKEARDYVMDQILAVIKECHITYVKWDFNRNVGNFYSAVLPPEKQGETAHRYVLALYEMQERLVRECPDLLFENCAGGGGRFDAGMLYYSPQIWCSDNTDPVDRLRIQYGTSFAYPISTMGAHVSVSPNHQTGRITPFDCRVTVAQSGTFGFELDLGRLTEEEKESARRSIIQYKKDEDLIQKGDYFRLSDPGIQRNYALWQFVSKDKDRTLFKGVLLRPLANGQIQYIRLRGLKEDAVYQDVESGWKYTGASLMYAGLPLPPAWGDYQAIRVYLEQVRE